MADCKKCFYCLRVVARDGGCNHVVCVCNGQMCFSCGGPYPKCYCVKYNPRIGGI